MSDVARNRLMKFLRNSEEGVRDIMSLSNGKSTINVLGVEDSTPLLILRSMLSPESNFE